MDSKDICVLKIYDETLRGTLLNIYRLLRNLNLREDLLKKVLDVVFRYIKDFKEKPRNERALAAAALYISLKNPVSDGVYIPKSKLAASFGVEKDSLNWYIKALERKLGFVKVRGDGSSCCYIDPNGPTYNVIKVIVARRVREAVIEAIIQGNGAYKKPLIVERILYDVFEKYRLLPQEYRGHTREIIEELVSKEEESLKVMVK